MNYLFIVFGDSLISLFFACRALKFASNIFLSKPYSYTTRLALKDMLEEVKVEDTSINAIPNITKNISTIIKNTTPSSMLASNSAYNIELEEHYMKLVRTRVGYEAASGCWHRCARVKVKGGKTGRIVDS